MLFHFAECDQKIDRIMSGGTGKAEQQGNIHMKAAVMTGKVKKRISVIAFIKVGIMSPGGIRVGIMPGSLPYFIGRHL